MTEITQINKAVTSDYGFTLINTDIADIRSTVKPGILTALMQPSFDELETDTFKYDKQTRTVALPQVKSLTEKGSTQKADGAGQIAFVTGSFGTGGTVAPQDYRHRRRVGGEPGERMTEADAIAETLTKIRDAWALHTEQGLADLITKDTNLLGIGGVDNIHPSYDYSLAINGASRVAEEVDFAGAASDVDNRFTMANKVKQLQQELSRLGKSAGRMVCLCGGDFFQSRYISQAQLELNRPLNSSLDLGTSAIPNTDIASFPYFNFVGQDGVLYIDVSGEIISSEPLVEANKGFLMPQTPGMLSVKLSPTLRRVKTESGQYIPNPAVQNIYSFITEGDWGVEVETESNRLYFNPAPQLIKELTLPA